MRMTERQAAKAYAELHTLCRISKLICESDLRALGCRSKAEMRRLVRDFTAWDREENDAAWLFTEEETEWAEAGNDGRMRRRKELQWRVCVDWAHRARR